MFSHASLTLQHNRQVSFVRMLTHLVLNVCIYLGFNTNVCTSFTVVYKALFFFKIFFYLFQGKPDLNTALPIRQTASIFKQPVTKVVNHPSNKVKTDLQRATEQPRQVSGFDSASLGFMQWRDNYQLCVFRLNLQCIVLRSGAQACQMVDQEIRHLSQFGCLSVDTLKKKRQIDLKIMSIFIIALM